MEVSLVWAHFYSVMGLGVAGSGSRVDFLTCHCSSVPLCECRAVFYKQSNADCLVVFLLPNALGGKGTDTGT